jgi:putative ABC transport system permease protein
MFAVNIRLPNGAVRTVNVRGVDPIALQLHNVKLSEGALPENHAQGCVVGKQLVGKLPGFESNGHVPIGQEPWPVTGVLVAPATQFESELWCDRTALMRETRNPNIAVMYVKLTGEGAQDAFKTAVNKIADQPLAAFSEREHFQRASSSVSVYVKAISIISLILAIGATLACINAVYIAFLGRIRELATLVAIGFTRGRIALITLMESLFLTTTSGLVGLALGLLVNGRTMTMDEISLIYHATVTPQVIAYAVAVAVAIGLLGAIASVIHALRLKVLFGLRATG